MFEDGIKQNVTFFYRRQQPIALSLLLDSSASMEEHLPARCRRRHRTSFIGSSPTTSPRSSTSTAASKSARRFTGNQAELDTAISQLVAGGSTSLHNAIYIALKELRKVRAVNEEDVRRQALIVFSDGEDTSSLVSFDEVLDLAKRSETSIYTIALRGVGRAGQGLQGSRVRNANARAGNRRTRVLPGEDRRSRWRVHANR